MKILQYICLHIKSSITQIAHHNTFHFLRYSHLRFAKCLFPNLKKQQNKLKSSLLFRKIQTLGVKNLRTLRIQNAKFSGHYFYMYTNIRRDFQICISVPLKTNETHVSWHVLCDLCLLMQITHKRLYDRQRQNDDKYWCEYYELIDKGECDDVFIWNATACEYEYVMLVNIWIMWIVNAESG